MQNNGAEGVLSVSEFLDEVNTLLKPVAVTVRGEISSVQERPTGIYFSISDSIEQAKLDCVLFRRNSQYYSSMLKQGATIDITGNPNIYKPYGKLSFIASHITPVGEGALQAAFEALKRQLENDGYFAAERKRPLPPFIKKIGLITSFFGDARKDFMTHLGNHNMQVYFHDARVEGTNSIPSLVRAIEWFNSNTPTVDVLVLTRGGGSLESLQAFNSLEVAQAIYKSRTPIISAVGHENDITIADMVADVRASTPTHAGKIIAEDWVMAIQKVESIEAAVQASFEAAAHRMQHHFDKLQMALLHSFQSKIERRRNSITLMSSGMISHYRALFTRFETVQQQLMTGFEAMVLRNKHKLDTYEALITAADPKKILKQGYSMTFTSSGKLVKQSSQLTADEEITTHVGTGKIKSKVITTLK